MPTVTLSTLPFASAGRPKRVASAALAAMLVSLCASLTVAQTATPTPTLTPVPTATTTPVPTLAPQTCYAVPDSLDSLVTIDASTGAESVVGLTGAGSTLRGLAASPVGNTIYGATSDTLGTINPSTGAFTAVGTFGTALNGDLGPVELDGLVALAFNSSNGVLYGVHRTTLDEDTCYAVEATGDTLITIDATTGNDTAVGATSNGIEAAALVGSTLYAAIGDQLGVLDRSTGGFSSRSATFGQGDPGPVDFDDIRGLSYDVTTHILYAVNREAGGDDELFQVNLVTGAHLPLQFNGNTDDYVSITGGSCVSPVNIEAIAMDPSGTTLYGSDGDDLVTIDEATGACNIVGAFGGFGPAITITGLGFANDGTLYGTDANEFYSIDTGTGAASTVGGGLGVGSNHRALDCPIAVPDILFRIDTASGSYVPLSFDFNISDYSLIEGGTCGTEIEAIAYDLYNDVLLGIDSTNDSLVDIDHLDGFCADAYPDPLGVGDIVSMTYARGTNEVYAAGTSNLYVIDRIGGGATVFAGLAAGTDYEALECPTQGCPLTVRKRHVGVPYAGGEITYRLFWLNPCEGITFNNVVLTDTLPAGLELVSASSTSAVTQTSSDSVTFLDAILPKSPAQFGTLRARITASAGSRVSNTITLRDDYGREFRSTDVIKVREPRSRAALGLHAQSKSAPGKTVTYTARYQDIDPANDLTLTLPADVDIVTVYPDPIGIIDNAVTWSNLPAPAGGVRVRTRVSASLTESKVLTATAAMTDAAGADLESVRDTVVTYVAKPTAVDTASASISLAAAKQVTTGLVTTVSIKYRDVQGTASIEVVLPPEMSLSQATPEAQVSGNTLTWSGLPAGAGALKVKALVAATATPGSVLAVQATVVDSASGSASDSVQLLVRD